MDTGCIAIVSENLTYDPCQCDAELSFPASKECLKYLYSIYRGFSYVEMPLQSTGCYLSLCNNWHHSFPGTQSCLNAELSIAEQMASLDAMQLCVHHEAVPPALYTDTKLPPSNKSYFLLFPVQIPPRVTTGNFLNLFFASYLWLWISLLQFWCDVANPPQLQACLKITAFHRIWFRVGKRNMALSWCSCQDRILLMYAVITWISVPGTRNNDTCQHYKDRHLEKPTYL